MEVIFRIALLLSGLLNLVPSILAVFPGRISSSYGVDISNPNLELLLRHRAVFFLMVGGVLLFAALARKYYELAAIIGLASMLSFVVLYFTIPQPINDELRKVMFFDVVASIVLLIGASLYFLFSAKSSLSP